MNLKLTNSSKILLSLVCFGIATVGFMWKLPSIFRHHDKQMHALFYFIAAGFLNYLFAKQNLLRHFLIFVFLLFFGVVIEYAQSYSNRFFHTRIHGRFDIEDVEYNVKGLIAYSMLWITYTGLLLATAKKGSKI